MNAGQFGRASVKPEKIVLYIKGCQGKYLAAFHFLKNRSDQIIPNDFPTLINASTA